jgi:hypothetical protein
VVQLTKLHQMDMVEEYIDAFECLVVRMENLADEFFKQCVFSCLKEEIKSQVEINQTTTRLEAT